MNLCRLCLNPRWPTGVQLSLGLDVRLERQQSLARLPQRVDIFAKGDANEILPEVPILFGIEIRHWNQDDLGAVRGET